MCSSDLGEGDARTCTTPIGYDQLGKHDFVDVVDLATGVTGKLDVTCEDIFTGTSIAYQNAPGVVNGSGWDACHMWYVLADGRRGWGEMRQRRFLVNNVQTTEALIRLYTDEAGVGYGGMVAQTGSSPWTPPGPLSEEQSPRQGEASGIVVAFKRVARPPVRLTSFGTFVPAGQALPVRITAAPGSRCSANAASRRGTVTFGARTTDARGTVTVGRIPAKTLSAKSKWTVTASCTPSAGGTPTTTNSSFTVRELSF